MRRNRKHEKGQEIVEFALMAMLFIPMLLGTFIQGMNLIRSIQVNHVVRDLADMYIHGADFSAYGMQGVAKRLAGGLDLQVGSAYTGNSAANTNNQGKGLVTISQVMYIGTTTEPNCLGVGGANCTNHDKFVFTQRIRFGNGTLASTVPSSLGDPATSVSTYGTISSPVTNSGAALQGAAQTKMKSLWQTYAGGRTPLADGQVMFVVEGYFSSPQFAFGKSNGGGIYARYFF